jgi:hypothetical protein
MTINARSKRLPGQTAEARPRHRIPRDDRCLEDSRHAITNEADLREGLAKVVKDAATRPIRRIGRA